MTHQNANTRSTTVDRRDLVKRAAMLGALALAAPLAGCEVLGIENPYENQVDDAPTPGVADFAKLAVVMNLDPATWSWDKIENPASPHNGSLIVGVPMTATNNDEQGRVLNSGYCQIVAPDGTEQPDISTHYAANDILQQGRIAPGTTATGLLHILYRGPGDYTIKFDNLLGRKVDLAVPLSGHEATGMRPIPAQLGAADTANSIPYGTSFEVNGLVLTFSADELNYWWTQSWDESNPNWNGRWCVGVPLTITNPTNAPVALTSEMYGLFAPELYRLDDPAPWFPTASAAYLGALPAGAAVQSALFWPYVGDGWYYAVFDNRGKKTVASVRLAQY